MGHPTSEKPWGVVDLDTTSGRVFVQQRRRYAWCVYPGAKPWTCRETVAFHRSADRAIRGPWSYRLRLRVQGHAPFSARVVPINFDVRWVIGAASHYTVFAWKAPPGSSAVSPI